ncbi:MAG: putative Ig domain-containing protein [Betaproteobacteria bacterium]
MPALIALVVTDARADYASACAPCHAASANPEVDNLPNGFGSSGSIRAANNLAYLNTKIDAGMGNPGTSNLNAAARQAIVTEIGNSNSVSAPAFTSGSPPSGTVQVSYSHTFAATAAPTLLDNSGLSTPFTLASGALPPGVTLNGATGQISGTPSAGGFFTGQVRANNLIGSGTLQSFSISIAKLNQTVSFGSAPSPNYSAGGTFSMSVSVSSGLPLTFIASGNCSVANTNINSITTTGAGSCFITASQAGNGIYNSTQAGQSVTVGMGSQTISFAAQSPATRNYAAGLSFPLNPAATGGPLAGAITYATSSAQICIVSGTTVSVGPLAGTCTITATQNGNANYNSISVARSIVINAVVPTAPTINLAAPGNAQATIAFTPSASDGGSPISSYRAACNPGNVFADGAASPIIVGGLTNSTFYTCTVTATNAIGGTVSGSATVTPTNGAIAPGFTSPNNATFTVGTTGTHTVTATGVPAPGLSMSGTLPQGVTFTPGTGVVTGTPPLGTVGSYILTFTANNNVPSNAVQTFTLTVAKASQAITFPVIPAQVVSNARVPLKATSTSGLAVAYSSLTNSVCTVSSNTVLNLAAGTCTLTANQTGNANYSLAPVITQSFVITATGINTAQGQNDWAEGGGFLQFNACDTCHGASPAGSKLNAANSPTFIGWLYTNNFATAHLSGPIPIPPNATQQAELASYIGTFVPGTNPSNAAVIHNTSVGFTLPNITLGTGTLTAVSVVTAPSKGSVFIGSGSTTAVYTPFTGQSGPDAFTYRATGPAGSTDTRTAVVNIALPSAPVISSATSASGAGGTAFAYNIVASNAPTLYGATGLPAGLFINTSTGQVYGIANAQGTFIVGLSAGNAGGSGTATLTITISGAALTVTKAGAGSGTVTSNPAGINCGAQCTANFNVNALVTLSSSPVAGTAPAVWSGSGCSGSGNCVVTMDAAKAVTATFNAVTAPGAPTNVHAIGGDGQVTVTFTNPVSNGGAAIVSYSVTCNPGAVTTDPAVSPVVVSGLTNGVSYTCDVRANNGFFTGPATSASAMPQPPLALTGIVSRKVHGTAGVLDFDLSQGEDTDGGSNIEPRAGGAGFNIVFQFNHGLSKPPALSVTANDGNPAITNAGLVIDGSDIIVTVSGIPDNSLYRIAIDDIDGQAGFGASVNMAFLVGDVNATRAVNASDISAVKAHDGFAVRKATMRFDLNADGVINNLDVLAVKLRSAKVLPK